MLCKTRWYTWIDFGNVLFCGVFCLFVCMFIAFVIEEGGHFCFCLELKNTRYNFFNDLTPKYCCFQKSLMTSLYNYAACLSRINCKINTNEETLKHAKISVGSEDPEKWDFLPLEKYLWEFVLNRNYFLQLILKVTFSLVFLLFVQTILFCFSPFNLFTVLMKQRVFLKS